MSHQNEELTRRLFDLFRRGDRDDAVPLSTEDAVRLLLTPFNLRHQSSTHNAPADLGIRELTHTRTGREDVPVR